MARDVWWAIKASTHTSCRWVGFGGCVAGERKSGLDVDGFVGTFSAASDRTVPLSSRLYHVGMMMLMIFVRI